MMDTKEKILAAALALYNEKGISATTRHIAASMAISPGNLHYHFKHTDDIILELYSRLAAEMDQLVLELGNGDVKHFIQASFLVVYKYRFIFLNFVEIAAEIPSIQQHYFQLFKRRGKEFKRIFKILVQQGYFRDDIPDAVWTALVNQVFIVGDFWLSNNELTRQLEGKEAATAFYKQMDAMLYPYRADTLPKP
ncbi:TetR/AcrR family transcriptional regulator [Chitinophaga sp.]|uniref:TetR/AcrR family transcriptional regulator n=1 Tax=Chitinophaga sp. TaxID=1869181 RepID=UPI0031E40750